MFSYQQMPVYHPQWSMIDVALLAELESVEHPSPPGLIVFLETLGTLVPALLP